MYVNHAGFAQICRKSIQLSAWVTFHLLGRIAVVLDWDAQETEPE